MRLLVDISALPDNAKWDTGLAKYSLACLSGFAQLGLKDITVLCTNNRKRALETLFPLFNILSFKRFQLLIDSFRWRRSIRKSNCDVVFFPILGKKFDFIKTNKPFVQTIHDLQLYKVTRPYSSYITKRFLLPWRIRRANKIIAISEYTKGDILSFFKALPEDRVVVIHNGVLVPEIGNTPVTERPYILTVNSLMKYKNLSTLLRAFALIKDRIPHDLILVGKETEYWKKDLSNYIIANGLEGRVKRLDNLNEESLWGLYKAADVFVTTSLMEGFGYTPVEAAIAGTKVISTKETALPESTMGLVYYYEPATDPLTLSKKILEVLDLEDVDKRESISRELIKEYDPVTKAREIYSLLESLV